MAKFKCQRKPLSALSAKDKEKQSLGFVDINEAFASLLTSIKHLGGRALPCKVRGRGHGGDRGSI